MTRNSTARRAMRAPDRPLEHDILRSINAMTIGVVREGALREVSRRENALAERQLQFQVPVAGEAGDTVATDAFELDFDVPFYFAPGQRDSDFDVPQFSYGVQLDQGSGLTVSAHVVGWLRDDDDSVHGATLEVSTLAPNAPEPIPMSGTLHCTFQGWGALQEDETEMA